MYQKTLKKYSVLHWKTFTKQKTRMNIQAKSITQNISKTTFLQNGNDITKLYNNETILIQKNSIFIV